MNENDDKCNYHDYEIYRIVGLSLWISISLNWVLNSSRLNGLQIQCSPFFVGIFTTFSLIKIKKVWQLQNFGKVIYASVDNERGKCYYTYKNENYFINIYNVQKDLKNKEQILIRISIKEPEIWEYVDEK